MAGHGHKHIHQKKKKDILDCLVYVFMVLTPLFEVPQAYTIFVARSAEHVSPITWFGFLTASFVWVAYGIRNRLLPVIVTYSLYIIVESAIIVGILMYS